MYSNYLLYMSYQIRGAKYGGVATPLNFWEGVQPPPPPDFERTCCLIAHIGPFLIA